MNSKELQRHLKVGIYGDRIRRSDLRHYPDIYTTVIRAKNQADALELIESARTRGYIESAAPAAVILATCQLEADNRTKDELLADLFREAAEAKPEHLRAVTKFLLDTQEA